MPMLSGLRYWSVIAISLLCALVPITANCGGGSLGSRHPLRVLVISPQPDSESTLGICALLTSHGIKAKTISTKSTSANVGADYDVVIIAGTGLEMDRSLKPIAFQKPVLAMGHYGCSYLGLLKVKNGWPYT